MPFCLHMLSSFRNPINYRLLWISPVATQQGLLAYWNTNNKKTEKEGRLYLLLLHCYSESSTTYAKGLYFHYLPLMKTAGNKINNIRQKVIVRLISNLTKSSGHVFIPIRNCLVSFPSVKLSADGLLLWNAVGKNSKEHEVSPKRG